jgi:hypothetical protein
MWPLKTYYSEAVTVWLQKNGRPFTPYDVVENFTQAYIRTQTAEIAINGDKPDSSDATCIFCDGKFSEDTRRDVWMKCGHT